MKKNKIDLKDIEKCIESNTLESNATLLSGFLDNRQNTQNKVIFYRKIFLITASIYGLILLDIFDPSIIGIKFNEDILSEKGFGFNNLMEFMILLAPLTFVLLYYILVLALIHRSVLNTAINKAQKRIYNKSSILHYLNFPFSSGLLIGLINSVSSNKLIKYLRKLSKHIEFIIYIVIILSSAIILVNKYRLVNTSSFFAYLSLIFTLIILINTWRTLAVYLKQKKVS